MEPHKVAALKRRIRRRLAARRRQAALHPPIRPSVNYDEVAEISDLLNASAQDPDEWSS